ncbi:MAG: hypothetical protein EZS28_016819, partial [Streblomastix strix]
NVGVSTEYARGDHQHPLQVSTVLPAKDTAVGEDGVATTYARSVHTHHVNLGNSVPKKDTGTGTAGSANVYSSAIYQHPLNIDPTTANVPLVNATAAANGTSEYYCRNDHVHPQQLTYDGNVTATKFIKSGGLATEVLCANGDTTAIANKISREYNACAGGWIRLCNFPAGASVGSPFIEFKIYSAYNAVQTIKLVPYYTVNGINTVYGIFTAPTKVSTSYNSDNSVNQLFLNHSGSGTSAIYSAYVRLQQAGSITIVVSDQSIQYTNRITELLTQDVVQGVSNGTQIPITYDLANGGIINNMLQADHSVGLSINGDCTQLKFNNNELVNVGTVQTINGTKIFNGVFQVNPTGTNYNEGIRIAKATNGLSQIQFGCDPAQYSGQIQGQWAAGIMIRQDTISQDFVICLTSDFENDNRGLRISADRNTFTFNGSVIAGIGASNGGDSSVSYSQGRAVQWGINSSQSGGLYASGQNFYWNARTVLFSSVSL